MIIHCLVFVQARLFIRGFMCICRYLTIISLRASSLGSWFTIVVLVPSVRKNNNDDDDDDDNTMDDENC